MLLPLRTNLKGSCAIDLLLEQVTLTGVRTDKGSKEIPY